MILKVNFTHYIAQVFVLQDTIQNCEQYLLQIDNFDKKEGFPRLSF